MSTVPMSRQKIDSEIMYSLRRQGFTNKQIAKQLDVCVATVYNTIGRMSEAVKHAEVQNKPPVVDVPVVGKPVSKPVISENNGFKAVDVKPKEVQAPPVKGTLLTILSAKYTMQGELCQYVIDTNAKTVEMPEGRSMVCGVLDATTITRFIDELTQVKEMLTKEA